MTEAWLITGGAGYIGSHVVRAFRESGRAAIVLDDLSSGHRSFIPNGTTFIEGTLLDPAAVRRALELTPAGVIHLAGFKYAGESVNRPLHTYEQNVTGTAILLEEMVRRGTPRIVFSSSAAVYGTPREDFVTEETPCAPESPYGESKLVGEWLVADVAKAHGIQHTSLRYFNVVGSAGGNLRDTSPHNLFPIVFRALESGIIPHINGDDYDTPDGTPVRDYVHVIDVARAHVAAAMRLESGQTTNPVYNLGSGSGVSVRQIMATISRVTGIPFTPELRPRRAGDPSRVVADGGLAARDLEWTSLASLDDMISSSWSAVQQTQEND